MMCATIEQKMTTRPKVGKETHISEHAVVMGNVTIGDKVFIAPNATIRCDEPCSEIIIGPECNIQDNVVIHSLTGCKVLIGAGTSIGHGSIIHGPCEIGERCFIGFGSVVFKSVLGDDVMVMHRSLVEDTIVPRRSLVPSGAIVKGIEGHSFVEVCSEMECFSNGVRNINIQLAMAYNQKNGI
jgi:carbonic anhydrase/acetyltransferase-like protein (isoleucine patch superfamily)